MNNRKYNDDDKNDDTLTNVVLFPHKYKPEEHLSDSDVKMALIALVVAVATGVFVMTLVVPHL